MESISQIFEACHNLSVSHMVHLPIIIIVGVAAYRFSQGDPPILSVRGFFLFVLALLVVNVFIFNGEQYTIHFLANEKTTQLLANEETTQLLALTTQLLAFEKTTQLLANEETNQLLANEETERIRILNEHKSMRDSFSQEAFDAKWFTRIKADGKKKNTKKTTEINNLNHKTRSYTADFAAANEPYSLSLKENTEVKDEAMILEAIANLKVQLLEVRKKNMEDSS